MGAATPAIHQRIPKGPLHQLVARRQAEQLLGFVGPILMIIPYTCEIFRSIREKILWVVVLFILGSFLLPRLLLKP